MPDVLALIAIIVGITSLCWCAYDLGFERGQNAERGEESCRDHA